MRKAERGPHHRGRLICASGKARVRTGSQSEMGPKGNGSENHDGRSVLEGKGAGKGLGGKKNVGR